MLQRGRQQYHAAIPNGEQDRDRNTPNRISAVANLSAVMEAIVHIVEQETSLVRAGKLAEASRLDVAKTDLANRYYDGAAKIDEIRSQLSSDRTGRAPNLCNAST